MYKQATKIRLALAQSRLRVERSMRQDRARVSATQEVSISGRESSDGCDEAGRRIGTVGLNTWRSIALALFILWRALSCPQLYLSSLVPLYYYSHSSLLRTMLPSCTAPVSPLRLSSCFALFTRDLYFMRKRNGTKSSPGTRLW